MWRKLNSIGYGPRILAWIGTLLFALPSALLLCTRLLVPFGIQGALLPIAVTVSLAAGVALQLVFVGLLTIEFLQDRQIDSQYHQTQHFKIKLADGYYECQYCGSQKVRAADKQCPICGKLFDASYI